MGFIAEISILFENMKSGENRTYEKSGKMGHPDIFWIAIGNSKEQTAKSKRQKAASRKSGRFEEFGRSCVVIFCTFGVIGSTFVAIGYTFRVIGGTFVVIGRTFGGVCFAHPRQTIDKLLTPTFAVISMPTFLIMLELNKII